MAEELSMTLRCPEFSIKLFSELIASLCMMKILDAIIEYLHVIKMQCRSGTDCGPRSSTR